MAIGGGLNSLIPSGGGSIRSVPQPDAGSLGQQPDNGTNSLNNPVGQGVVLNAQPAQAVNPEAGIAPLSGQAAQSGGEVAMGAQNVSRGDNSNISGQNFISQNPADIVEERIEKLEAVPEIEAPDNLPEIEGADFLTKEIYQEVDDKDISELPGGGQKSGFSDHIKVEDDEYYVRKSAANKKHFVGDAIFHIEVDKIKPNPFQPRKQFDETALRDLANSIREFGILQPLVVSKIQKDVSTGTEVEYQLIAGERRWRAAKLVGLPRVPVIIRQPDEQKEHLELAIIENLQRSDLDLIETARAYARLQDEFRLTQREVALRLGKSREAIANTLRLLSLPSEIQEALSQNRINESQARLLISVENPIMQKQLFQDLLVNNLSVRDLRNKIRAAEAPESKPVKAFAADAKVYEMQALERKLKEVLGTDVHIDAKGEGGKIIISFYSPEEVYGIVHKINPDTDA